MNPSSVKLFLALLWLIPGIGCLVHGLWAGQSLSLPFGPWRVPLAVPCLIFAALNFVRWWSDRTKCAAGSSPLLHHRRPRRDPEAEPDPTFRFDVPPSESTGRET
jgi:hypothetical protein